MYAAALAVSGVDAGISTFVNVTGNVTTTNSGTVS